MLGWRFSEHIPNPEEGNTFEKLLKLFQELLIHTSGNVSEALSWLTQLDKEYNLTNKNYGMADFIDELIEKGYIQQQGGKGSGGKLLNYGLMNLVTRLTILLFLNPCEMHKLIMG